MMTTAIVSPSPIKARHRRVALLSNKVPGAIGGIERCLNELRTVARKEGTILQYIKLETPRRLSRMSKGDTASQISRLPDATLPRTMDQVDYLARRLSSFDWLILAGSAPMFVIWSQALQRVLPLASKPAVASILFPFQELEYYLGPERLRIYAAEMESVLRACQAIVVPSEFSLVGLRQYFILDEVHKIPLGGGEGVFEAKGTAIQKPGPTATAVTSLSSFAEHKNGTSLLALWPHVVARVPEARLVLIGNGTEFLPPVPGVLTLGPVSDDEKRMIVSSSACTIQISSIEAFGLTTVESFALGTPVVGLRAGATTEIVFDRVNGLLIDTIPVSRLTASSSVLAYLPQPAGLVTAVCQLLSDGELQAMLSRSALDHAQQFSWRKTWELYRGLAYTIGAK